MSTKKIVLIESDATLIQKLTTELGPKGLEVVAHDDGKTAVQRVSQERPDLVVLGVELSAGQSGYIVCGKLKKDNDLKQIPVVITGKDAEGFEAHKRLKAHAEDYLKKPFETSQLLEKIGALIELPALNAPIEQEESFNFPEGDDEPLLGEQIDTVGVKGEGEARLKEDPDLDALDAAFETISDKPATDEPAQAVGDAEAYQAPAEDGSAEQAPVEGDLAPIPQATDAEAGFDAFQDAPAEQELATLEPVEEAEATPAEMSLEGTASPPLLMEADSAELASLRESTSELSGRVRELTDELAAKANELEALKGTHGGKDRELFAAREQNTRKDKEILKLKQDLHDTEKEVVELREKENELERKVSELTTELAKSQAQVKTLSQRTEGGTVERKKLEHDLAQAKDEWRQQSAKLAAAQRDLEAAHKSGADLKRALDEARHEAQSLRAQGEQLQTELDAARADLESRTAQAADETASLRARIGELEEQRARNEERVVKAYQKLKIDEKAREKTKKALSVALQILEEAGALGAEADGDQAEKVA
jgi:CheY-like chemotaxis protein